jgi:exodeoxyribonuclease V alpha subunit
VDIPESDSLTPNIPEEPEYEALDYQLADLMVELNDFKPADEQELKALNKTLSYCTLEISKRTREGQISNEITLEQQQLLLQTTVVGEPGEYMPLIVETDNETEIGKGNNKAYLYLNRYWQYQQHLADQINARIESKESLSLEQQEWANKRLADYFKSDESLDTNERLDEKNWQKRAAELALHNKFLIVSGGPGTGKTTTITRLLALLIEQHLHTFEDVGQIESGKNPGGGSFNILLAAPTGKAAIRMLDSIREVSQSLQTELSLDESILAQMPKQASTIHKLLGFKPNSAQFKHNRDHPLNADVVLVDEASMIDIAMMSKLIDAVPEHAKLILIGDKDQLASVETGSVFADICEGLKDKENIVSPLVTLRKNYRFAANSDIGQCAIAANQGDSNTLLNVLNDSNRAGAELILPANMRDAELIKPWHNYFAVLSNPESSLPEIFAAFNQYRILCALRRGLNGSQTMTSRIETALEKQDLITRRRGYSQQGTNQQSNWYHGRPIMITQNSYSRGLFNGDTGITLIRDGEVKVYFPATDGADFISFSPVRLPAHETTWAMTIHKSQGSEFNQVVLILPQEDMPLLTRQLVYTGITRAKETVSIVASEDVLVAGVKAEVLKATRIEHQLKSG